MLQIKNMTVSVGEKIILNNISLDFQLGKNYAVLGKNGSGKSSLAMTLMGHPKYEITGGKVFLDGEEITSLSPDQRAQKGIFLAFQAIPEIPGIKLFTFLKAIYDAKLSSPTTFLGFKAIIEPLFLELHLDKEFLWRDLNVGFSGGERRKLEVLQIKLLHPKYIILDEIDSGLDVDAFKTVVEMMKLLDSGQNSFIIITHIFSILDILPPQNIIILKDGMIKKEGGRELLQKVKETGFETEF